MLAGQVVDAWRQIAVQANSLQGVFNVQYNLNVRHTGRGNQPARVLRRPHQPPANDQRANFRSSAGPNAIITVRP